MQAPMKIRQFRLSDYEEVRRLWQESGLEIRPGDALVEVRRKLLRDPELFLVAVREGRVIGSVIGAWDGRRGWLYHLGVLPGQQRSGVATSLVSEAIRRMEKKGVLKVNAIVYRANKRSLAFFRGMGFVPDPLSLLHGMVLHPTVTEARSRSRGKRGPPRGKFFTFTKRRQRHGV